MKLLFINSLKGIDKKKIQILAIITLILLSTGIYTAVNISLDRVETRYFEYLDEQNVEDFSFSPVIDYTKDITSDDIDNLLKLDLSDDDKEIIKNYQSCLKSSSSCNELVYISTSSVFNKYGANLKVNKEKIDGIANKYDFSYEVEVSKLYSNNKLIFKAIPYSKDKKINKMYLIEGEYPKLDNEITMLPKFALKNNLELGDWYTINNVDYKIVGFSYASDHVYPLVSMSSPIFDEETNNIIFMNEDTYSKFLGVKEEVLAAKFNYKADRAGKIAMGPGHSSVDENGNKKSDNPVINVLINEEENIELALSNIARIVRTDVIQNDFKSHRIFVEAFLYLLLGISVFIIIIVIKKRIEDEKLQIGVLKSLGYSTYSIATSYLIYPFVGAIAGGLLGYLMGLSLNDIVAKVMLNYYTVPLSNFVFSIKELLAIIIYPLLGLSIISYLTALFMLRKKPLELLKEGSNLKINFFSKLLNKIISFLPFEYRFKYSLAFRSIGKLLIVSITSFMTGLLIVLILIGSNLFTTMIDKTFEDFKFNYIVNYNSIQFGEYEEDDLTFEMPQKVMSIKDKNNKKKDIPKEDVEIDLVGIDTELKYMAVLDKNENNLISELHIDNNIVLNKNVAGLLNVVVGDILTFKIAEQDVDYTITGISESYMGNTSYVNRDNLTELFELPENAYNKKYSNDKKYSNLDNLTEKESKEITMIFSIDDLEKNIKNQMSTFNGMIYVIIFFASFMALVIISVIANIIVEENKRTISLMKVLGYTNKKIGSIVLNIYTPFLIVSYLISIPAMKKILTSIIKLITADIGMAIPIELSPVMAMVGLGGLLTAYYIAINLSKIVINKIPLAVALKRE